MYTTTVHQIDGEFTVNVPSNVAQELGLMEGSSLDIATDGSRLVLRPHRRNKYTLEDLLAQCDFSLPLSEEDKAWDAMKPAGRELI